MFYLVNLYCRKSEINFSSEYKKGLKVNDL